MICILCPLGATSRLVPSREKMQPRREQMVFMQTYKPAKRSIRRSMKEDSEKTREEIYSKVGGRRNENLLKPASCSIGRKHPTNYRATCSAAIPNDIRDRMLAASRSAWLHSSIHERKGRLPNSAYEISYPDKAQTLTMAHRPVSRHGFTAYGHRWAICLFLRERCPEGLTRLPPAATFFAAIVNRAFRARTPAPGSGFTTRNRFGPVISCF